ncbi:hypothetical protein [Nostoc sp.]|uniref:hypothetical protein n=1 Tax=Nostoc sp. TaxID=1180 RepID=UPI002FFB7FA8
MPVATTKSHSIGRPMPDLKEVSWEPPEVWIGGFLRSNFSLQRAGSLIASLTPN